MYIEIIIILLFNYSQGNVIIRIIRLFKFTPEYGPLYRQYKMSDLSKKTRDGMDENHRTFRENPLYTYTQEAGRKGSLSVRGILRLKRNIESPQLQLDVSRN